MQRIAVVTGANKGIGYEIAKQLLTTCTVVVLACRNRELGEAAVKQLTDNTNWRTALMMRAAAAWAELRRS